MWIAGKQPIKKFKDFNSIVMELSDDRNDEEARILLAKFLRANIGFTFELLSGVEVTPMQELILKALFLRDNGIIVCGRGVGKSFIISIFCLLYPIFYPNSKLCLISANFRGSRRILEYSDKIIHSPRSELLRQCFPKDMRRAQDLYRFELANGAEVFALPLSNGEGLRGTRANCVCVDEGLLITKEIQQFVIRPFLTNKSLQQVQDEKRVKAAEDELISAGVITEADRITFPRNKYFVFSSASYKFEYLYELYTDIIKSVDSHSGDPAEPTYFAIRASYEAVPAGSYMDLTQINAAKANGGENTEYFKREYKGQFSDSGDGYFNVKKMHECTVAAGSYPTLQLKGDKDAKYILAIDPSYSASKSSDYFAMGVYLLNESERKMTLVHTYGRAGGDLKDHFSYLAYLLTYFNIVFVTIDASGTEFITGFNESSIAAEKSLKLDFLDVDMDNVEDPQKRVEELSKAKRQYNLLNRRICYAQKFTSENIRRMNEHLQNQIDAKKVWFGATIQSNEEAFNRYIELNLPSVFKTKNEQIMGNQLFIEEQDAWISETKAQLALIEVKSTTLGTLQFDMPQNLRRETGINRPRKDNYTCMLIGCWATKMYFDIMFAEDKQVVSTFTPFVIH